MSIPSRAPALLLPLVLALALAACSTEPDAPAANAALDRTGDDPTELVRVDFTVAGMDCAGCVLGTRAVLRRLDGVEDAGASFETVEASPAWAVYDPERVTPERMIAALAELGYTATVSRES